MTDWIKQQAERIKHEHRTADEQRHVEVHKQKVVRQHWTDAWQNLVAALRYDTSAFNAELPDEIEKHIHIEAPTELELVIRRADIHQRAIEVAASAAGVKAQLLLGPPAREPHRHDLVQFEFDMGPGGDVVLASDGRIVSPVAAAERILHHLFE